MSETRIQLVEINHTTLTQWFNRQQKKQEQGVLKQGIQLLPAPATTSKPLPPPVQLPPSVPQVQFPFPYTFKLPENSVGMGKGRRLPGVPTTQPPKFLVHIMPKPQQQPHFKPLPGPSGINTANLPRSAFYQQKRTQEIKTEGERKRKYQRKDEGKAYSCGQCGQVRDPKTHKIWKVVLSKNCHTKL